MQWRIEEDIVFMDPNSNPNYIILTYYLPSVGPTSLQEVAQGNDRVRFASHHDDSLFLEDSHRVWAMLVIRVRGKQYSVKGMWRDIRGTLRGKSCALEVVEAQPW